MMWSKGAGEMPVLPGMVETVMRIVLAFVVPYPMIVSSVDVRRVGVPWLLVELATFRSMSILFSLAWLRRGPWRRGGTTRWNVSSADFRMSWTTLGMTSTLFMTAALRMSSTLAAPLGGGE